MSIIKTDRFIAIPEGLGKRLYELAEKRTKGLTDEEEKEFNSLLERINIITSKEVATSYELTRPRENISIAPSREMGTSTGEIDSNTVNRFLTEESLVGYLSGKQVSRVPSDANHRYTLLKNGNVVEIGTGKIVDNNVIEIEYLTNGFYKVTYKNDIVRIKNIMSGNILILIASTSDERCELIISPDKRFAFVKNSKRKNVETVVDIEKGEEWSLEEGFPVITGESFPKNNNDTYDLKYSRDGRYLTYMEEDCINGHIFLVAVDLGKREIVKKVNVGKDVEYEINPYANVVYVKRCV